MNLSKHLILIFALLIALPAAAQDDTPPPEEVPADAAPTLDAAQVLDDGAVCPTLVQEAFTATSLVCEAVRAGQICLGNGVVDANLRGGEEVAFAQPGDVTALTSITSLQLQSLASADNVWAVTVAKPQMRTEADQVVEAFMLAFGDVTLSSLGGPSVAVGAARTARVLASGGMNVRRTPEAAGVVVWYLQPQQEVIATGITENREWIRIEIPSPFGGPGWVYAPYLQVAGGSETLPTADINSPRPQISAPETDTMRSFTFASDRTDSSCTGTPHSGIMLQTANGVSDNVLVEVNGLDIAFNGTLFMSAQPGNLLVVDVLEGEARIGRDAEAVDVRAGSATSITLSADLGPTGAPAQPADSDSAATALLPVQLMPRPFGSAADTGEVQPVPDEMPEESAGLVIEPAAGEGDVTLVNTPIPEPSPTPTSPCILTAADADKNLRGGPGTNYDAVAVLSQGNSTLGAAQVSDGTYVWYQTVDGYWIRFDTVEASPECEQLPEAQTTPVPPDAGS